MAYSGRRGAHVSQYLRNLNVQEPAVETFITDDDLAKDLALFTNTHFLDFETGQNTDYQAPPAKPETSAGSVSTEDAAPTDPILGDFSSPIDFIPSDFNFGDFSSSYTSPTIPSFPDNSLGNLQPIQPNPQTAYPPPVVQHQSGPSRMLSFEDASRLAAEEDKRKRNTAASARFRIKKKQREQALEKSAKEMTDKVTKLEGRISALETENKWLKSLVTEKHGGKDDIVKKLLKEFSTQGHKGIEDDNVRDGDSDSASGSSTAADDSDSKRPAKKRD